MALFGSEAQWPGRRAAHGVRAGGMNTFLLCGGLCWGEQQDGAVSPCPAYGYSEASIHPLPLCHAAKSPHSPFVQLLADAGPGPASALATVSAGLGGQLAPPLPHLPECTKPAKLSDILGDPSLHTDGQGDIRGSTRWKSSCRTEP